MASLRQCCIHLFIICFIIHWLLHHHPRSSRRSSLIPSHAHTPGNQSSRAWPDSRRCTRGSVAAPLSRPLSARCPRMRNDEESGVSPLSYVHAGLCSCSADTPMPHARRPRMRNDAQSGVNPLTYVHAGRGSAAATLLTRSSHRPGRCLTPAARAVRSATLLPQLFVRPGDACRILHTCNMVGIATGRA